MNESTIKKLELELKIIKNSTQYKLCKKIFYPIRVVQKIFNNIYDIKLNYIKKLYKKTIFQTDKKFLNNEKKVYKKAVILGNAKNLKDLIKEEFSKYKNDEQTLTIGINRSFYSFNTKVILWADYEIIDEITQTDTKNLKNTIIVQTTNNNTKENIQFWINNKSFKNYPNKGLFKARNILVSALHLCYLKNIKEIELYGFEFDSREYFFDTDKYDGINEYEIKVNSTIEDEFFGYDTKKIVREVLEFMLQKEFKISYTGKSNFLSTIAGLKKNDK